MQQEQALDLQTQNNTIGQTSRIINHTPVYYGWVIAAVGTLGMIMTSPGQTYAIAIFIEHFIEDLGISRSLVSTLYSGGSLLAGFTLPFIGRRVDRHGSRIMMTVTTLALGLTCLYMGFVANAIMLAIGFLALRIFGQGALSLVSTNVVNQWWVRRRGMVMGISGLFISFLGLAGFPNLINALIPVYGWRVTFIILALLVLVVMLPIGFIFLRDRPEQYGLQPDGAKLTSQVEESTGLEVAEENWTVAEVIRTVPFWITTLGIASMAMASTGLFFHMVSIFNDNGLSPTVAATVFVPIAVTTAIVTLSSGILVDHLPARILLTIALLTQTISLVMAPYLYTVQLAFLYGIILGTTFGLVRTVGSVIWATYYGRLHLGSITGVTSTIMVIGASLGPMPLGVGRDLLGSYTTVLLILAVFPLLLAIANLFVGKPEKGK